MAAQEKAPRELEKARTLAHVPWCEDYEKMISGMLYNAFVPELASARFRARAWAHKYNHYFPTSAEDNKATTAGQGGEGGSVAAVAAVAAAAAALERARLGMLRDLMGDMKGDEVFIEPPFAIDYGCNIRLGDRFYANFNLIILDCALVTIGDRVMCGPNVSLLTATHEVEVQSRRANVEFARPITIGNDCWIGAGAVILPGVTIGDGCTVGAAAVVTRDVPPWSVVVGSPARVVKKVTPLDDDEAPARQ